MRGEAIASSTVRAAAARAARRSETAQKASTKRRTDRRPARGSRRLNQTSRARSPAARTAKIAATPIKLEMAGDAEMVPMTPREEPGTTVQKAEELAAAGPKTGRKKTLSQKLLRSMSSRQQPRPRKVSVGGYDPPHSKDNVVTTSKFSWWNFLPWRSWPSSGGWPTCISYASLYLMLLAEETGWYNTPYPVRVDRWCP